MIFTVSEPCQKLLFFNPGRSTPTVNTGAFGSELSVSPGRLIDTNLRNGDALLTAASLVGEFLFNGNTLFVIGMKTKKITR